jgi:hypothetical protein
MSMVIIPTNPNNNKSQSQKDTQAYELYNKGKKPVEVAIQLDLPHFAKTLWQILSHLVPPLE